MAVDDQEAKPVVIKVVYDGPPEAGKTTSLRALARGFGHEVYTPEEQNGRTVYFDWLEHTGGRFDGAPIHCQVATIPGQVQWAERRSYFLDRADVVVFVANTSESGWPESIARLRELRARLDARDGPAVGIVFQANRRDAADAVPMEIVRARIASERIAVVESVAPDGAGVREAFVFAVRLALDRVRESIVRGTSSHKSAGYGEQILDVLQLFTRAAAPPQTEVAVAPLEAPAIEAPPPASTSRIVAVAAPLAPSQEAPSGFVWPPVEGRILLREATRSEVRPLRTPDGSWAAELADQWHLHSSADAEFTEIEQARAALIEWARLHASALAILSSRRCIVLAETGASTWRLWQIVRRESTLRELFTDGGSGAEASLETRAMAGASRLLAEARTMCDAASLPWPCTLDTIGVSELGRPVFIGLVSRPGDVVGRRSAC